MNKKILAFLLSILMVTACLVPITAFADDTAEPVSDAEIESEVDSEVTTEEVTEKPSETVTYTEPAEEDTTKAPSFDISLEDILNSDIIAAIMGSDGFVDLTQIVFDIMAKLNKDELEAMGKEKAQQVIQSTFDTIAGMITQIYNNKDLLITYDPLEVIDNLFDTNTSSLTTQAAPETTDPNELVFNDGDVDKDGRVTAADARLILRRAAEVIRFTDEQDKLADVDKDGKVTAVDARIVLRISAGLSVDGTDDVNSLDATVNVTP